MDRRRTGLRFGRRKTDDTVKAFHDACDAGDLATADELLVILEDKFSSRAMQDAAQGNDPQQLLQAQARLWTLRRRHFGDVDDAALMYEPVPVMERPVTSKLGDWFAAWLRNPQSRFEKAPSSSSKGELSRIGRHPDHVEAGSAQRIREVPPGRADHVGRPAVRLQHRFIEDGD